MREIKFRAWDNDAKKMIYNIQNVKREDNEHGLTFQYHLEFNNVMQYIGLKDDNDKNIYEGDIIKLTDLSDNETIHKIEYCSDTCYPAFELSPYLDHVEENGISHAMENMKVEIIGNIYENPELIPENKE